MASIYVSIKDHMPSIKLYLKSCATSTFCTWIATSGCLNQFNSPESVEIAVQSFSTQLSVVNSTWLAQHAPFEYAAAAECNCTLTQFTRLVSFHSLAHAHTQLRSESHSKRCALSELFSTSSDTKLPPCRHEHFTVVWGPNDFGFRSVSCVCVCVRVRHVAVICFSRDECVYLFSRVRCRKQLACANGRVDVAKFSQA